jgi:hypothetical protein
MKRVLIAAVVALSSSTAFAQHPYDGLWNVTIETRAGDCQPSMQIPLTISEGKVSGSSEITGSIGREGGVRVSIRGAHANGQISGNAGSGKWNGASAGLACSGRWQAARQ